jgi:hypothetical protein
MFRKNKIMFKIVIKYLWLTCLPVIGSLTLNPMEVRAADLAIYPKEMLRIEFLAMERHRNGQTSQAFAVHPPSDSTGPVTVLYLENKDPVVYRAPPVNQSFAVHVDKPSCIRIFALARDRGKIHVTCTDLVLFGKSKTPAKRTPAVTLDAAFLRAVPHIYLKDAHRYYWCQTGIPLTFTLNTAFQVPVPGLNVLENNSTHAIVPAPGQPSRFVYTPPHDKRLKQSGGTATRQDTLFTTLVHDGTQYHLAYALQVHRSRYAHDNHKAGAVTLTAGFFLFTGFLLKKRKKTWWKE